MLRLCSKFPREWVCNTVLLLVVLCHFGHATRAAEPYRQLRSRALEYAGPDVLSTNNGGVIIGWFAPTNTSQGTVDPAFWAARYAISNATARAGSTLNIQLLPCWTAQPWSSGAALLVRFIYDKQPLAVMGSVDSASTHLAEQVVAKANLPLISFVPTDGSLTLAGVPWMFSCAPSDSCIARSLVPHILQTTRLDETIALVSCMDHGSRMSAKAVMGEFSKAGRLPASHVTVDARQTNFMSAVSKLRDLRPATVLVITDAENCENILAAVYETVPTVVLYSTRPPANTVPRIQSTGSAKVWHPVLLDPQDTNAWTSFSSAFKAEFHRAPDFSAAASYDATHLLLQSIQDTGPSRAKVRNALANSVAFKGISGLIDFDGTGQNLRATFQISAAPIYSRN